MAYHPDIPLSRTFMVMTLESFLDDWAVRATWMAYSALFSLWCASWLASAVSTGHRQPWSRRVVIDGDGNSLPQQEQVASTASDPASTSMQEKDETQDEKLSSLKKSVATKAAKTPMSRHDAVAPTPSKTSSVQSFLESLKESRDMLRDLSQMLISALTVNTFASGTQRTAMVISYFFLSYGIYSVLSNNAKTVPTDGRWSVHKVAKAGLPVAAIAIIGLAWYEGF
ncbi:hypothetical protein BDB00DRAFT_924500 [Zychaea mexicana]|uniref:uncharacterized protein n=1 Tax=Zychaea mexicana TaxID=64656 RepID=UPI0022FDEC29|nr:uncharacterized protein BDB00DRAFT_924500 [Zychaea mexicana]KAI9499231.1 hypothetical protein BDB00DRAFT_924500 [Zychaea mexicana]